MNILKGYTYLEGKNIIQKPISQEQVVKGLEGLLGLEKEQNPRLLICLIPLIC